MCEQQIERCGRITALKKNFILKIEQKLFFFQNICFKPTFICTDKTKLKFF